MHGRGPGASSIWLAINYPSCPLPPQGTGWKSVFYCNDWVTKTAPTVLLNEADTWLVGQRGGGADGCGTIPLVLLAGRPIAHILPFPSPRHPSWLSLLFPSIFRQAKSKYNLDIHTSDVKGAEFEGLAYVTLSGWWGTSKEVGAGDLREGMRANLPLPSHIGLSHVGLCITKR